MLNTIPRSRRGSMTKYLVFLKGVAPKTHILFVTLAQFVLPSLGP